MIKIVRLMKYYIVLFDLLLTSGKAGQNEVAVC